MAEPVESITGGVLLAQYVDRGNVKIVLDCQPEEAVQVGHYGRAPGSVGIEGSKDRGPVGDHNHRPVLPEVAPGVGGTESSPHLLPVDVLPCREVGGEVVMVPECLAEGAVVEAIKSPTLQSSLWVVPEFLSEASL